jgi:hypothetical protein
VVVEEVLVVRGIPRGDPALLVEREAGPIEAVVVVVQVEDQVGHRPELGEVGVREAVVAAAAEHEEDSALGILEPDHVHDRRLP